MKVISATPTCLLFYKSSINIDDIFFHESIQSVKYISNAFNYNNSHIYGLFMVFNVDISCFLLFQDSVQLRGCNNPLVL